MGEKPKIILDAISRYWLLMWTATSDPVVGRALCRAPAAPPTTEVDRDAEEVPEGPRRS